MSCKYETEWCKNHVHCQTCKHYEIGKFTTTKNNMREILFRGKSVDIYGWLYGHYVHQYGSDMIYLPNGVDRDCGFDCYFIKPETVGQYTGLTDKNGKKIFEGDIVTTNYNFGRGGYYVFEVYYNENLCQFALTINSGSYTKNKQYDWLKLTALKANKIEVIGNIHDNPELLKEQDNER